MNEPTTTHEAHEAEVPSVARYTATPGLPAPAGHEFASLCWLVARHPGLAEVAARVPGAVDTDGDVMPWVLAAAITDLDEHHAARLAHDLNRPLPTSTQTPEEYGARLSAWAADAPTPDPTLAVVQDLSAAEIGQLRLLATFNRSGVRFGAGMLDGLAPGRALLGDWLTAVHHLNDIPTTTSTAAVQDTATRDDTSTSTSADEDDDLDDDEAEVSAEEEYYSSIWWEDSDQDDLDTLDDVEEVTSRSSVQAEAGPGQLVIPARTASPTGTGVAGAGIDQDWWQHDTTTSATGAASVGSDVAGADRDDGWSR